MESGFEVCIGIFLPKIELPGFVQLFGCKFFGEQSDERLLHAGPGSEKASTPPARGQKPAAVRRKCLICMVLSVLILRDYSACWSSSRRATGRTSSEENSPCW